MPFDKFSKYFLSFFFQAGVSITDQYFLFLDLAYIFLMSAKILSISSGDFFFSTGLMVATTSPSFSMVNFSRLYFARSKSSKNLFLASVAESVVFILYIVYKMYSVLSRGYLLTISPIVFDFHSVKAYHSPLLCQTIRKLSSNLLSSCVNQLESKIFLFWINYSNSRINLMKKLSAGLSRLFLNLLLFFLPT